MTERLLHNPLFEQRLFPPGADPAPGSVHERYVRMRNDEVGRWGTETLAISIRDHASNRPQLSAFIEGKRRMTWGEYHDLSNRLAGVLVASGMLPQERIAVLLPDGPIVHAVYIACEKAGLITVGIGPRAGHQEVRHLLNISGASAFLTVKERKGESMANLVTALRDEGLSIRNHFVIDENEPMAIQLDGYRAHGIASSQEREALIEVRHIRIGDIFLLNSTSGTTGMPKCVVHTQNRWRFYHHLALEAGRFSEEDVFMGLIPAPFGFGLWTAHFSPSIIGCPTVVMERFVPELALELIEREKVSVLSCVSTQFIMMLNSDAIDRYDLSSLKCMFTGGEAIPFDRAREFEEKTGAKVVQFYGSNETGALSYCGVTESFDRRLRTSGKVIEAMHVRLFDDEGIDVTAEGGPGQAGCAGPATSLGYYADTMANDRLFTTDGSMLTGDICIIDEDRYLKIVGRKSDFIIRGGKNISAAAVEEQVGSHPRIANASAIAMPDPVFGERVCVYVVLRGGETISMAELHGYLRSRGVSQEVWPERIEIVSELPHASGGKVAKGPLRDDIRKKLLEEKADETLS
jgi:acyl-CoA synthetase